MSFLSWGWSAGTALWVPPSWESPRWGLGSSDLTSKHRGKCLLPPSCLLQPTVSVIGQTAREKTHHETGTKAPAHRRGFYSSSFSVGLHPQHRSMILSQGTLVTRHSSASSGELKGWYIFSSVQFSRSVVSDYLRPHESQHARPPCPSPTPGVCSNSCPSS